jgi:hypothetical protein
MPLDERIGLKSSFEGFCPIVGLMNPKVDIQATSYKRRLI